MEDLVNEADRAGKVVALTPSTDFGATSVGRLEDFYRRFGFARNRGPNKDFRTRKFMIRHPR